MNPNFCSGCGGVWGISCGCQVPSCNYTVINETNPVSGVTNAVNINTAGIGVLDAFNANTLYFRGGESANGLLTITLNATNHTLLFTVNAAAIAAALPQATTTQAGIGETATDAEAQAKASTTVLLTPSNLAALPSSTVFAGLTAYATNAQAITGTSTTLALTPAAFTAAMAANYGTTVTFVDAVARAAASPSFIGQFGGEQDNGSAWLSTGVTPGTWNQQILTGQSTLQSSGGMLLPAGITYTFTSGGVGSGVGFGSITVDFDNTTLTLGGGANANSLFGTDGSSVSTFYQLSNFLSIANTSTGWTGFTNSAVRKTGDCNTITTAQLAQVVDTLINALKNVLLPSV